MLWAVCSRSSQHRYAPEQKQGQEVQGGPAAIKDPSIGSLESATPPMTHLISPSVSLSKITSKTIWFACRLQLVRWGMKKKNHGLWKKRWKSFHFILSSVSLSVTSSPPCPPPPFTTPHAPCSVPVRRNLPFSLLELPVSPGGLIKAKVKSHSLHSPCWEFSEICRTLQYIPTPLRHAHWMVQ